MVGQSDPSGRPTLTAVALVSHWPWLSHTVAAEKAHGGNSLACVPGWMEDRNRSTWGTSWVSVLPSEPPWKREV